MNRTFKPVMICVLMLSLLLANCELGGVLPETSDSESGTTTDDGADGGTGSVLEVVEKYGTISSDETWEDGKVYHITQDVHVEAVLTIEPGCIIKFHNNQDMKIRNGGKVIAIGTEAKRIHFTGMYDDKGGDTANSTFIPEKQDWDAVKIMEPDSIFQFCTFEFGDDTLEVVLSGIKVTITDNIFKNNYYGLCARYAASAESIIERNRFFLNTYPIIMDPPLNIGNTNMFTSEDGSLDNLNQSIHMYAWGGIQIDENVTFSETELPYWGGSGIEISNNSTLTLDPGIVITMSPMTMIQLESGSDIILSSGSVITSTQDDSLNGNPSSPISSSSYWEGIRVGYGSSATYRANVTGVYFSNH